MSLMCFGKTRSCQEITLPTCIEDWMNKTLPRLESLAGNSRSRRRFITFLSHPYLVGVSLNRGENLCICSTALGGGCLWFANQDADFWTTATVWQRHKARGLSVFKAKGPLSLTVSVCHCAHISRDGTSMGCCCWGCRTFVHAETW